MAYTLFRRRVSCWDCHSRRVNLFTVHGSTGILVGILCARCCADWLLLPTTSVVPLHNRRARRHRRRLWRPALG